MRSTLPYKRARENRVSGHDESVQPLRKGFFRVAARNFLILQILFLALFAFVLGSIYKSNEHTHNINILYVDFDGGVIGRLIREAYDGLRGDTFPSLREVPATSYSSPSDLEHEICHAHYWGALYATSGASERLQKVFEGGLEAHFYNKSDVLVYILNEARYPTITDTAVVSNIQKLSSAARTLYGTRHGMSALQSLNSTDSEATAIFVDPWQPTAIDIQETSQGARLVYNTLVVILVLIQEFFYLGTINGLYVKFKIYARLWPHRIIMYRTMISLLYTFIGSLCAAASVWAFRNGWDVNGKQFVLTWMSFWLFGHVNFLSLDVFTIWLPHHCIPMALITWLMFNVTSILVPFELMPGFYRWTYVMPAHELYQILVDIWSRGCNPRLYYALPTLFALEISGLILTAIGVHRRCHYAAIGEEKENEAFQKRLEEAMAYERARDAERDKSISPVTEGARSIENVKDENALATEIRRNDKQEMKTLEDSERRRRPGISFDLL
ncbi:MAG: hypothetical protein Q9227_000026 [Pyrenula ochraceoflavens]